MHSKCRKYYLEVKERIHIIGIKVNKGNFTATLIRFNQTLTMKKFTFFDYKYKRGILTVQVFSELFFKNIYI